MKLRIVILKENFDDPSKAVLIPTKLLRNPSLYQKEPEINVRQRQKGHTGSRTSKELERTKRKIQKDGVKHPLGLRIYDNGKLEIIDGTHRLLISSELGLPFVPVRFVPNTLEKPDLIDSFFQKHKIKPKFVNVDQTFIDKERKVLQRLNRRRKTREKEQEPVKTQSNKGYMDDLLDLLK